MTILPSCLAVIYTISCRSLIVAQARGIKPVLECGGGAVMLERAPIPHTLQRRHLVVSGALACFHRVPRIRSHAALHHVEALPVGRRWLESVGRNQLVVCVQRRSVAASAAFAFEDRPSFGCEPVESMRIGRRIKRM